MGVVASEITRRHGCAPPGADLEGGTDAAVQSCAVGGVELAVEGLAIDVVGEPELVVRRGPDEACVDGGAEPAQHDPRRRVGHGRQHVEQQPVAQHAGDLEQTSALDRQGVEPARHRPGDDGGERRQVADRCQAGELADEQGVAAGSFVQLDGEPAGGERGGDRTDQLLDSVQREAFEVHVAGVRSDRRQPGPSRWVEFVVTKRADHQQPSCSGRRDHVVEQVECRRIRPLEVVEHDDHVPLGGQVLEPLGGGVEQQQAMSVGVAHRSCGPTEVSDQQRHDVEVMPGSCGCDVDPNGIRQPVERLHPWPEAGRAVTVPTRAPTDDRRHCRRIAERGPNQRCLADPGLAADQDH